MHIIKKSLLSLAVASVIVIPATASAEGFGSVSANIGLVTDYYFRGISQTDNDGAIQGGFDWSHDSGAYVGVWGSNVSFGDTNLEFDTYAGFANEIGDFGYDVGVIKYNYNDTSAHDDPVEWYMNGSYSVFSAGFAYSPSWFGSHDSSKYIHMGLDFDDLPMGLALSASVGKSFGDAYEVSGGKDYDYVDYKIGVSKEFYGLGWDLSYVGNDLSDKECNAYGYAASKGNCDDRFILSVSKSIDDVSQSSGDSSLPISANIALVTDYYFRGISQSDNDGAIQGGFDWSHDSGAYVGVWASNVSFGDTNIETDTYAGFANEIGDFGYDVGVIKYNYNDTSSHDDPIEWYINGSYSFFSAGFAYSPSWFGSHDSSKYMHAGLDFDQLPMDMAISASVGKSFGDAYEVSGGTDYDYVDYKVGVSKDIAGVNVDLSYVGNDLSNKECNAYGYAASKGNCDDRFILSFAKSF